MKVTVTMYDAGIKEAIASAIVHEATVDVEVGKITLKRSMDANYSDPIFEAVIELEV